MSRPIASTRGVYIPGVGITITRANIEDEQARRVFEKRREATPEEIVSEFVTPAESAGKSFPESKRYNKLVARATKLMRNPKPVKSKK